MTAFRAWNHRPLALICLVLVLGTAALYWPITHYPFILYDDEQYVTGNPHVTTGLSRANFIWAFTNSEAANWHPLTWLSHQLDCALFGANRPSAHHLINLLFHIANTLLLFIFLRKITGAMWRSALVAALFAWHPLHVESVAWASERKDVLSAFFFLLTLLSYIRFAESSENSRFKSSIFYALALLLFACGLMSKPMVVTLPFVLLLLDFWPLNRIQIPGFQFPAFLKLFAEKVPFFILTIAACIITYRVQSSGGAVWPTPLPERAANAMIAYARYVAKTFCPSDLALVYSHPKHWPVAIATGAGLALATWTFLCLREWRRRPFLACGWFWFLGTLVPTIGIVQVGAQAMADRYSYLPSIGLFLTLVWGGAEWAASLPERKRILGVLGGAALVICLVATSIQITFWRDSIRLFRRAMEVSPDNYVAANCLGKAYEKSGDNEHALVLYRLSVEAEPRFPQSRFNYAMMLLEFGNEAEGLKQLQAAAELEPRNPDIQFDLGIYFARHASWTNAANCFSNTVSVRPDFAPAQAAWGGALADLGDYRAAALHFREALRLKPDSADAQSKLNRLLKEHPEVK